jgi:hypothetical protein
MKRSAFPFLLLFFLLTLGVVIVSQKQQDLRTRASASTTLSLLPLAPFSNPITKRVGDTVSFDVMLNPGSNQISTVKMHIVYDSSVFEVSEKTGFVTNKKAFPVAVEGPIIDNNNDSVIATFFVGADPNQAIKTPVKIGTLTLKAIKETYNFSSSKIFFEETSRAYSISSKDYAFENVIATTNPAYVIVRPKDATPIPTGSAGSPLRQGSEGQAGTTITPSIGATPSATAVPLPTQPSNDVKLSFKVFYTGIGKGRLENKFPEHTTRFAAIYLIDSKNFVSKVNNVSLQYDEGDNSFNGVLTVPNFESGTYTIQIKGDGYLQNEIGSSRVLTAGSEYTLPSVSLVGGDINNDGKVSIIDYNFLFVCSTVDIDPKKCSRLVKMRADLDDNGKVDENDQFIFIKQK